MRIGPIAFVRNLGIVDLYFDAAVSFLLGRGSGNAIYLPPLGAEAHQKETGITKEEAADPGPDGISTAAYEKGHHQEQNKRYGGTRPVDVLKILSGDGLLLGGS